MPWALCCSRHKLPENQGWGLTSIPAPLLGEITSDSKKNRMQGQKFQGTQNVLSKSAPRGSPLAATRGLSRPCSVSICWGVLALGLPLGS